MQAKDLVHRNNVIFHVYQRLTLENFLGNALHRRSGRAHQVIRPNDGADAGLAKNLGRRAVVAGRHNDQWRAARPLFGKSDNLVRLRQFAVDENGIRTGQTVGLGPAQRLIHAPTRDQRLDARDNREIAIPLGILAGGYLAHKFLDIGERLALAVQETVGLWKLLVLDANARNAALLELTYQTAHIVEIAIPRIAVEQYGQIAGIGHELEHVHDLRPAGFIVVAHAKLCGYRQTGSPNALEARLAHDARGQAVMRFHEKFQFRALQHLAQFGAARLRRVLGAIFCVSYGRAYRSIHWPPLAKG